jgi:hypothetical protein
MSEKMNPQIGGNYHRKPVERHGKKYFFTVIWRNLTYYWHLDLRLLDHPGSYSSPFACIFCLLEAAYRGSGASLEFLHHVSEYCTSSFICLSHHTYALRVSSLVMILQQAHWPSFLRGSFLSFILPCHLVQSLLRHLFYWITFVFALWLRLLV